jgi:glycosyltransferase involved in cell wall biosynthesis
MSIIGSGHGDLPHRSHKRTLNLLMVAGFAPFPPRTGAQVREWEQIRYLGARHRLTLACLVGDSDREIDFQHYLAPYCAAAYGTPFSGLKLDPELPQRLQQFIWQSLWALLKELHAQTFDAVLFDGLMMAPYRDLFRNFSVLTEHNIESSLTELMAESETHGQWTREFEEPGKQARMLRAYEDRTWARFPLRTVVSETDRKLMSKRVSLGRTVVVENGAYLDRFVESVDESADIMLFTGCMSYHPNIDGVLFFVDRILPRILRHRPSARLVVAGRDPDPKILALREQDGIEVIPNPADMYPLACRSRVSVVPIRLAGGTRIKILESMAWGLPVVSTRKGSEGLAVEDGIHLLMRDDPENFADAVLELFRDTRLYRTLRINGRRLVVMRYSWEAVFEPLHRALLEELD